MKFNFRILLGPGIIIFYFATRFINLKIVPIFTDEAIYNYWAQVALHDPANRFMSLEDGKQPLFIWIAAVMQKFIADPLIASRLVSVFAGFGSLIGIYLLTKTLFNKKIATLACLLYIILPFTLLYDRLALYDSLLTMFGIWAVFFSVKMAKSPQLDTALLNGFVIGFGLITKSSANFFLYLLPFSLLLFDYKQKNRPLRFIKWLLLTLITAILALVIYNSLRLSPLFYMIDRKNQEFIRPVFEVLGNPTVQFPGNFRTLILWLVQYNGWPLLVLAMVTIIWAIARRNLSIIFLSIYIIIPFFVEGIFNKIIYPRFMLFFFPFIIIIIAFAATHVVSLRKSYYKFLWLILMILILIQPIFASYRLLTNPPRAKIADSDLAQYFNSWPAGYGVSEIVKIIKGESQHQDVVVGTEGTFGLLPFAIQIYFYNSQNVQIIGYWPVSDIPQQILETAKTKKTYFVFNEKQNLPDDPKNPRLKLVGKYQKGIGASFMRLYEIIPQ